MKVQNLKTIKDTRKVHSIRNTGAEGVLENATLVPLLCMALEIVNSRLMLTNGKCAQWLAIQKHN